MATSSLLTTADLETYLRDLKANDCEIERGKEAGIVTALVGEDCGLAAIGKGGNAWIVRFIDSDRITRNRPEGGEVMATYGDARASTRKQEDSPETQKDIMRRYAAFHHLGDVTFFVDPASSGKVSWGDREAGH